MKRDMKSDYFNKWGGEDRSPWTGEKVDSTTLVPIILLLGTLQIYVSGKSQKGFKGLKDHFSSCMYELKPKERRKEKVSDPHGGK